MKIAMDLIPLLVRLGLAVYEAIQKGDRTKTVGEIFDGVPKDMAEIRRLREEARERLGP